MKIKTIVPMFLSLLAFNSFAGQDRGGGNVVVCKDGEKVSSIELLDYYEGRTRRDFEIDLGNPNAPVFEIINVALDRLAKSMPLKAEQYRRNAENFLANTRFFKNIRLTGVEDSRHLFLPANCALEQAAVQIKPEFDEDKIYNINQDIWDQLDNLNKAGLILHEIIYSDARSTGAINSSVTRRFNALLASSQFEHTKLIDLRASLKNQIRSPFLYQGVLLDYIYFYPNGAVKRGNVFNENQQVQVGTDPSIKIPLTVATIYFYENGSLEYARVPTGSRLTLRTPHGMAEFICDEAVSFFASGIYQGGCRSFSDVTFSINGERVILSNEAKIGYYTNGNPSYGKLRESAKIGAGKVVLEMTAGSIEFWNSGKLKTGTISKNYLVNVGENKIALQSDTAVKYYETGSLETGTLFQNATIKVNGGTIVLAKGSNPVLRKSGALYVGKLAFDTTLRVGKDSVTFRKNSDLTFHENGEVESGIPANGDYWRTLEWNENGIPK